jgi:hypothetical protein
MSEYFINLIQGDGLYAIEAIKDGSFIAPYEGDLLTEEELNEKYGDKRADYVVRLEMSRNGKN